MRDGLGFDRPLRRDWLDFLAASLAQGVEGPAALASTRRLVAQTVADPGNANGAAGKTMTLLRRIWVDVPPEHTNLRDRAVVAVAALGPGDRLAIHWAMCELAYPFYLDTAATVGRLFDVQETLSLGTVRARLAERWGARGTLPQASQRLLKMWEQWGVLTAAAVRGEYGRSPVVPIRPLTTALVAEARVRAAPNGSLDLDTLQRASDLFPFELPDVRDALRGAPGVMLVGQGGRGWMVRAV